MFMGSNGPAKVLLYYSVQGQNVKIEIRLKMTAEFRPGRHAEQINMVTPH